ncbi:MAG TPA: hypothetical protein PKW21_10955 [Rhabdaerophilum sp.]|nr:hypothetical protein [Rhabdaerophilum sp.]
MSAHLHPVPPETVASNLAHHHHEHGHVGEHGHHHHHHLHAPARKGAGFSLISLSGWARLGLDLPAILILWLLTFWAMTNG